MNDFGLTMTTGELVSAMRVAFRGTRTPDFFIVGAPKCGTTALAHSLGQHPDIFMTSPKEPHAFGSDLSATRARLRPDEYAALFRGVESELRVGEASVWYLRSQTAAQEIHAFEPSARIIVMLRNPVDALYSLHGQAIRGGREYIRDFRSALAAEPERREGNRLGRQVRFPSTLLYSEAVDYAPQLERYIQVFGRDRVLVILLDDVRGDADAVMREAQGFLQVPIVPQLRLLRMNEARTVRSTRMQYLMKESVTVRRVGRALVPERSRLAVGKRVARHVERANTIQGRAAMPADVRVELTERLGPSIDRLGSLLGRDLGSWKAWTH